MLRRATISLLSYFSWQVIHVHTYQLTYFISVVVCFLLTLCVFL